MADVLYPIAAILGVIKDCSNAKKRVKQNKRKSALLVDSLEAIEPILLTIDKQELAGTMGPSRDAREAQEGGRGRARATAEAVHEERVSHKDDVELLRG